MRPSVATTSPRCLGDILKAGERYLSARGIAFPRLSCEWMASRLLQSPRLELYLKYDLELSERQLAAMRRGLKRVGRQEPVQYVLGEWDFRGRVFKVDRRSLIPRPETEELVQRVVDCEKLWSKVPSPLIVDIGTGTGCIVISLALERPRGRYVAVDIRPEALDLARENAEAHRVSKAVRFYHGELGGAVLSGEADVIVANLPYIPSGELAGLPAPVRDYEPVQALDGGYDGLQVVRRVLRDAVLCLAPGGFVFLEIGERQGRQVLELMRGLGFDDLRSERDCAGRPRFVSGRLKNGI